MPRGRGRKDAQGTARTGLRRHEDRKSTRLNSSHLGISYAVFCLKKKISAFHDETGRLNVDGMNIISNDGSNKLNRSRKARVSYKVQRTINASLNAATSTRAVSSNPNFVTRQKIEIIFCYFFFVIRLHQSSTLFPYTTLFR